MTKRTKCYVIVCTVILVGVIVYTVVTRLSFQGSRTLKQLLSCNDVDNYTVQLGAVYERNDVFKNINSYQELKEQSDICAKIYVTNERKLYANTVYTKAIVEKVYTSDCELDENDEIYIYEPVSFQENFEIYDAMNGYQLMRTDNEYYIFLNKLPTVKEYKKKKMEEKTYIPSTVKYSVYSVNDEHSQVLDRGRIEGDGEAYRYKDIKNYDILTTVEDELEKYNDIKKLLYNDIF